MLELDATSMPLICELLRIRLVEPVFAKVRNFLIATQCSRVHNHQAVGRIQFRVSFNVSWSLLGEDVADKAKEVDKKKGKKDKKKKRKDKKKEAASAAEEAHDIPP